MNETHYENCDGQCFTNSIPYGGLKYSCESEAFDSDSLHGFISHTVVMQ